MKLIKIISTRTINYSHSELETKEEIDPSPEMTAAIEAGLRSAENEPCYTVEEAREKARQWARRSSGNFAS